ncbi:MAG: hypothetical protein M3072_14935, partial [Candidatus Dormibacteraeota bacterium]|nr:hypothetical protein [Candidatus Dormibacteraeota bacterium]
SGSELDQVLVSKAAVHADLPLHVGQPVPFSMTINNWGRAAVGGAGAAGTFGVCEWLPRRSDHGDWFRWGGEIHGLITPGRRRLLIGGCRAPDKAGEYIARVALAQEATGPAPGGAACCEIAVSVEPWPE